MPFPTFRPACHSNLARYLRPPRAFIAHRFRIPLHFPVPQRNFTSTLKNMAGARGCFNCGGIGHQAANCPKSGTPTCYNCGTEGHISRDCTAEPKAKTCYKCGQEGHIVRTWFPSTTTLVVSTFPEVIQRG